MCLRRSPISSSLRGPIASGVQSFTRTQVGNVVKSDAFATAWIQANRLAHDELVKALTGEGGGAVTVENDTVSLNLTAFIQVVKQQLVASGFTVAERIPQVNASFVLFKSADIVRVRSGFNLLTTLGNWLPVIVLVLLAAGVYVARDHRRALVGAGLGLAVSMLVLALGLAVFRAFYLDAVPAQVLPHDAAAVLYDTLVRFLRAGLRTVLVVGLVVAVGAFLTGQSVTAVRTRQSLAHALGWLGGSAEQAGLRTARWGPGSMQQEGPCASGLSPLAALALVFWSRPPARWSSCCRGCWSRCPHRAPSDDPPNAFRPPGTVGQCRDLATGRVKGTSAQPPPGRLRWD